MSSTVHVWEKQPADIEFLERMDAQQVMFMNTAAQVPGVIMMLLTSGEQGSEAYDPEFENILVVFNASPEPKVSECNGTGVSMPSFYAPPH